MYRRKERRNNRKDNIRGRNSRRDNRKIQSSSRIYRKRNGVNVILFNKNKLKKQINSYSVNIKIKNDLSLSKKLNDKEEEVRKCER